MTSTLEKNKQHSQTKSTIVVDKNPLNLAASWYVAMLSKDVGKKPKEIQLFGRDLVAWRDGNGKPVIMERYCSHMGASLAVGEIKEGCIQCPFHHWRYDNSGHCVFIPDLDSIPPTARQATYVTQERYGYIWVWYGSSSPMFPLPEYPAAEDQKHKYLPWRFAVNTTTTGQRVLENIHDQYHIITIHKLPTDSIELTVLSEQDAPPDFKLCSEKGAWYGTLTQAKIKRFLGPIGAILQFFGFKAQTMTLYAHSWPSGYIGKSIVNGKEIYLGLTGITPIAENKTIWHVLVMVKKTGFFLYDMTVSLSLGWQNQIAAEADKPVFDTMKLDGGGAYIKHDRGVLKFREFCQKWVDKAEI